MSQKTEKPGEGATFPSLDQINPTKENEMNIETNSTMHADVQSLSILELSTLSTGTRRMLEALEPLTWSPRCRDSDAVSSLFDNEMDILGARLDLIASEIIKRAPANENERTERYFALMLSASANRMTLEEFIEFHRDGEPS